MKYLKQFESRGFGAVLEDISFEDLLYLILEIFKEHNDTKIEKRSKSLETGERQFRYFISKPGFPVDRIDFKIFENGEIKIKMKYITWWQSKKEYPNIYKHNITISDFTNNALFSFYSNDPKYIRLFNIFDELMDNQEIIRKMDAKILAKEIIDNDDKFPEHLKRGVKTDLWSMTKESVDTDYWLTKYEEWKVNITDQTYKKVLRNSEQSKIDEFTDDYTLLYFICKQVPKDMQTKMNNKVIKSMIAKIEEEPTLLFKLKKILEIDWLYHPEYIKPIFKKVIKKFPELKRSSATGLFDMKTEGLFDVFKKKKKLILDGHWFKQFEWKTIGTRVIGSRAEKFGCFIVKDFTFTDEELLLLINKYINFSNNLKKSKGGDFGILFSDLSEILYQAVKRNLIFFHKNDILYSIHIIDVLVKLFQHKNWDIIKQILDEGFILNENFIINILEVKDSSKGGFIPDDAAEFLLNYDLSYINLIKDYLSDEMKEKYAHLLRGYKANLWDMKTEAINPVTIEDFFTKLENKKRLGPYFLQNKNTYIYYNIPVDDFYEELKTLFFLYQYDTDWKTGYTKIDNYVKEQVKKKVLNDAVKKVEDDPKLYLKIKEMFDKRPGWNGTDTGTDFDYISNKLVKYFYFFLKNVINKCSYYVKRSSKADLWGMTTESVSSDFIKGLENSMKFYYYGYSKFVYNYILSKNNIEGLDYILDNEDKMILKFPEVLAYLRNNYGLFKPLNKIGFLYLQKPIVDYLLEKDPSYFNVIKKYIHPKTVVKLPEFSRSSKADLWGMTTENYSKKYYDNHKIVVKTQLHGKKEDIAEEQTNPSASVRSATIQHLLDYYAYLLFTADLIGLQIVLDEEKEDQPYPKLISKETLARYKKKHAAYLKQKIVNFLVNYDPAYYNIIKDFIHPKTTIKFPELKRSSSGNLW